MKHDDPTRTDGAHPHAAHWLALAAASVAVSGLFAILIALARVPAIGQLFPGAEFYRVALTLHVNLSQGVWFMAFAGALWSLVARRTPGAVDHASLACATLGAVGIAASVAIGTPQPLMSNYLPVLDSPVFLASLVLFGAAILIRSLRALLPPPSGFLEHRTAAKRFGLWLAAPGFALVVLVVLRTHFAIAADLDGIGYFELLFWAGGHCWQFVLVILMMYCWLELAPARSERLAPRTITTLFALAALPVCAAAAFGLAANPDSAGYHSGFTRLMQWASWPAPLALLLMLGIRGGNARSHPGLGISVALFLEGLLIGSLIDGQTTLVTAHYHGTVGAVTVTFMALAIALMPRLGSAAVPERLARIQLGLYGYGIQLMMLGLAGAGLMGAPRKTPGELGLSWGIESISRIMLGLGGLLATSGILVFAYLMLRHLWPSTALRPLQDDVAH